MTKPAKKHKARARRHRLQMRTNRASRIPKVPTRRDGDARHGGSIVLAATPREHWTTNEVREYAERLQATIADGADPMWVQPHIARAREVLQKREG